MGRNPTQIFPQEKEARKWLPLVSKGGEAETQEGRPWGPPTEALLSFLMEPPSCQGCGGQQPPRRSTLMACRPASPRKESPVSVRD